MRYRIKNPSPCDKRAVLTALYKRADISLVMNFVTTLLITTTSLIDKYIYKSQWDSSVRCPDLC